MTTLAHDEQLSRETGGLRKWVVWVLLGVSILVLIAGLVSLFVPSTYSGSYGTYQYSSSDKFTARAQYSTGYFLGWFIVILPLLALALSAFVGSRLSVTRAVGIVAASVQGLALIFGLIASLTALGVDGFSTKNLIVGFMANLAALVVLGVSLVFSLRIVFSSSWSPAVAQYPYYQQQAPGYYPTQPPVAQNDPNAQPGSQGHQEGGNWQTQ